MSQDYGFTFNMSTVKHDNGKYEVGINLKDSDGHNFDRHAEGMDFTSLLRTLTDGVSKEFQKSQDDIKKQQEKLAAEHAALAKKRNELQSKLRDIQAQINAIDEKDNKVHTNGKIVDKNYELPKLTASFFDNLSELEKFFYCL